MRILDVEKETAVNNAILYLKMSEAKELLAAIEDILKWEDYRMHIHVSEDTYQRELTVLLYDENNTDSLDERSRKLISDGI